MIDGWQIPNKNQSSSTMQNSMMDFFSLESAAHNFCCKPSIHAVVKSLSNSNAAVLNSPEEMHYIAGMHPKNQLQKKKKKLKILPRRFWRKRRSRDIGWRQYWNGDENWLDLTWLDLRGSHLSQVNWLKSLPHFFHWFNRHNWRNSTPTPLSREGTPAPSC